MIIITRFPYNIRNIVCFSLPLHGIPVFWSQFCIFSLSYSSINKRHFRVFPQDFILKNAHIYMVGGGQSWPSLTTFSFQCKFSHEIRSLEKKKCTEDRGSPLLTRFINLSAPTNIILSYKKVFKIWVLTKKKDGFCGAKLISNAKIYRPISTKRKSILKSIYAFWIFSSKYLCCCLPKRIVIFRHFSLVNIFQIVKNL